MKVVFNDVDEFLEELKKDPPHVSSCVRLTKSWRQTSTLPIQHVSVVCTYRNAHGECVELDRHVGQTIYHGSDQDDKVHARCKEIMEKIEAAAKVLNLEVRAGRYQV